MFKDIQKDKWGVLNNADIGILKVLFPKASINPEAYHGYCIYTGKSGSNTSTLLYLPYVSRDRALNCKEGLYNYIKTIKEVPEDLLCLEEEDFFEAIKLYFYFGIKPSEEESTSIFPIFKNLLEDFETLYTSYIHSGLSYRVVFSSLITLFNKSYGISSNLYYNKFLKRINALMPKIRRCIEKYLWSDKTEIDFLKFLYNVNRSTL